MAAVADIALAGGQIERSRALLQNPALLGAAAEFNERRGKYAVSDLKMTRRRGESDAACWRFYWDGSTRKNKKTHVAGVRDGRAVVLLERVTAGRKEGPAFTRADGLAVPAWLIYRAIRRSTLVVFGVPLCPTELRAVGTQGTTNPFVMAARLGNTPLIAEHEYARSLMTEGVLLLRDSLFGSVAPKPR